MHVHNVSIGGSRRRFDPREELDEAQIDMFIDYDIKYYLQDSLYCHSYSVNKKIVPKH